MNIGTTNRGTTAARAGATHGLSPRLTQVLFALTRGLSEKQVAATLGISPHTVHVYVKDLYRRYGASSRGEFLAGWIDPNLRAALSAPGGAGDALGADEAMTGC